MRFEYVKKESEELSERGVTSKWRYIEVWSLRKSSVNEERIGNVSIKKK